MKSKLSVSPVSSVRCRCARGLAITWLALAPAAAPSAADKPGETTPAEPPTVRILVLPFQNATGDAAWDDWRQGLSALVKSFLNGAEFTHSFGWKTIQPALSRAGWNATNAVDARLARMIAQDLNANVAI